MTESTAYFITDGSSSYRPTMHAQGAWAENEIHFSPLGGLLVHAIERHRAAQTKPSEPLMLSRVGFDILGFLALRSVSIRVETKRPGRTIELVEAVAKIDGRDAAVARAWYTVAGDSAEVAGGFADRLPEATPLTESPLTQWPGGFVRSLGIGVVNPGEPGNRTIWVDTAVALVDGEDASPLARWIGLVDVANGIAARVSPGTWMFPNVDLTIHLHRQPSGARLGLDTRVTFGENGQGITHSVLHDEGGPVGFASQALTVRRLG